MYIELDVIDPCAIEDEKLIEEVTTKAQTSDSWYSDEPQGFAFVVEYYYSAYK